MSRPKLRHVKPSELHLLQPPLLPLPLAAAASLLRLQRQPLSGLLMQPLSPMAVAVRTPRLWKTQLALPAQPPAPLAATGQHQNRSPALRGACFAAGLLPTRVRVVRAVTSLRHCG